MKPSRPQALHVRDESVGPWYAESKMNLTNVAVITTRNALIAQYQSAIAQAASDPMHTNPLYLKSLAETLDSFGVVEPKFQGLTPSQHLRNVANDIENLFVSQYKTAIDSAASDPIHTNPLYLKSLAETLESFGVVLPTFRGLTPSQHLRNVALEVEKFFVSQYKNLIDSADDPAADPKRYEELADRLKAFGILPDLMANLYKITAQIRTVAAAKTAIDSAIRDPANTDPDWLEELANELTAFGILPDLTANLRKIAAQLRAPSPPVPSPYQPPPAPAPAPYQPPPSPTPVVVPTSGPPIYPTPTGAPGLPAAPDIPYSTVMSAPYGEGPLRFDQNVPLSDAAPPPPPKSSRLRELGVTLIMLAPAILPLVLLHGQKRALL